MRGQLAGEKLQLTSSPGEAGHVAVALLAFFYGTSEATDLCYQAGIGKETCRSLSSAPEKPAPLRKRG